MPWDPERPMPPDDGAHHTHTAATFNLSAAQAGAVNDEVPDGEWRLILTMTYPAELPAGHELARIMTFAEAMELVDALTQAAGDLAAGRFG